MTGKLEASAATCVWVARTQWECWHSSPGQHAMFAAQRKGFVVIRIFSYIKKGLHSRTCLSPDNNLHIWSYTSTILTINSMGILITQCIHAYTHYTKMNLLHSHRCISWVPLSHVTICLNHTYGSTHRPYYWGCETLSSSLYFLSTTEKSTMRLCRLLEERSQLPSYKVTQKSMEKYAGRLKIAH